MPKQPPVAPDFEWKLDLLDVKDTPEPDGSRRVELVTDNGKIGCRYHPAETGDRAIVWVFGAGGGWGGPAGGMYPRLAKQLVPEGVTSLEVAYRYPGMLQHCVLDALMAVLWLESLARSRIAIVGHSFGGAVVITAASLSDRVK